MQIEWRHNLESAIKDARLEHKHILLDFHNPL
jgi:hypothetical protein